VLKNQGNIHPSWASRLRSADVNKFDRLVFQHSFNKHPGQGIIGRQDRVARFDQPIKQPFRWEDLWVQANSYQIPVFEISDIFHALEIIRVGWTFAVQVEDLLEETLDCIHNALSGESA
jgi:hypothetical protein